ncbi:MAG: phospholipase A [Gammaproteobacteria bacterium]|nr:MAG: phospholipase A [Gammaproteobacteria bacterium]
MHRVISSGLVMLFLVHSTGLAAAEKSADVKSPGEKSLGVRIIEDLEETCRKEEDDVITERICFERHLMGNRYALLPHHPNYVMPLTQNASPNKSTWELQGYEGDPNQEEVVYQISFKFPLWVPIDPNNADLRTRPFSVFIGYTQRAFWQLYNKPNSAPFRETNHEPELLFYYFPDLKFNQWAMPVITLGINHQSNGRSEPSSRSWNRVYLDIIVAHDKFALSLRPWYRIPESRAEDDNRDILDYMGYGDLKMAYRFSDNWQSSILVRNNLEIQDENRGAVQLDVAWASNFLNHKLSLYGQVFHGYGESLIDYNHVNTRVGIGFLVSNWL